MCSTVFFAKKKCSRAVAGCSVDISPPNINGFLWIMSSLSCSNIYNARYILQGKQIKKKTDYAYLIQITLAAIFKHPVHFSHTEKQLWPGIWLDANGETTKWQRVLRGLSGGWWETGLELRGVGPKARRSEADEGSVDLPDTGQSQHDLAPVLRVLLQGVSLQVDRL